eukprot:gnl/MRDRNA2_/MRDRNA2_76982_c1_seq2.p1 gnl/MRDRNA2_/MRDRNA2_76982_c1~~gnl/MRDRNA2_/MRDRNA2_76982_c1_seq2.p1  ORF type:complete len:126 (+),score=26.74 gnl/MRDRNA2_/MRDRNA2_76982_c1_seq2:110-487(+)
MSPDFEAYFALMCDTPFGNALNQQDKLSFEHREPPYENEDEYTEGSDPPLETIEDDGSEISSLTPQSSKSLLDNDPAYVKFHWGMSRGLHDEAEGTDSQVEQEVWDSTSALGTEEADNPFGLLFQ